MDKNKMGEAIKAIASSFTSRSEAEANERIEEALKLLNESEYKIKGPEDFDCFIGYKVQNCMGAIAKTLYDSINAKHRDKADFIFINYRFLECNIRELCTLREGPCCCADKSRYILKMYLKYSIDGEIPEFNENVEEYWMPNFGDNEMWMKYCDSLYKFYYGYTEEYFKVYKSLVQCEVRKFKHILHRWHIKFKNGEDFEFTQSWDDRTENPLKYDSKGDYYILKRKYSGSNDFEKYEPRDEETAFFYKNCVCIPKKDVEIYSIDEEKMC